MKVLKTIKKIFFAVFGKVWWFVVALVVCLLFETIDIFFPSLDFYLSGLTDPEGSGYVREFVPDELGSFSINERGESLITTYQFYSSVVAVYDHDTGKKISTNVDQVNVDNASSDYFIPYNFIITDDGVIYALSVEYYEVDSNILYKESVVRLTKDLKYSGTVCDIGYDVSRKQRHTKISDLHYYNGKVTFSVIEDEGVWLYSIDTNTQALSISDFYPTDPNGTYTFKVIAIDDAFLFFRSDGNVYRTGFNEPLEDIIYQFGISAEGKVENPYFNVATVVNDKLYVADRSNSSSVYLLENGRLTEVFDTKGDYGRILHMDSYNDTLFIACDHALLAYRNGELHDDTPVLHYDPLPSMYIIPVVDVIIAISLIGIAINLIIRKKTLLYKQLILILPVLIVIMIILAVNIFTYYEEKTMERINNDLTLISDLATPQFEGYDFSALMSLNEDTGAVYKALSDKFDKLSSNAGEDWANDYIFKIVYRTDDDSMSVLVADDTIYLPLYTRASKKFTDMANTMDGMYVDYGIESFFSDDEYGSDISILRKINDKNNTGRYYLLVSTDTSSLSTQRTGLFFKIMGFSLLAIVALILIIILSFLNTMRVIKKASKTVKKISNGDLTASVNYKSKDELGQICSDVDEMGKNLEKLFAEKDKTEKFYYKFVPEKFRELLGKDSFTDLELGDAKSCELTVLFTDIRGFSINSEMMTAKENFAFANIIYGKMGPIVRKNNGFVDKYIGDAVMGLFENADDAVRCGIELYKTIVLDPSTAEELNVSDINIGIGIHTGMAMVGIVGEEERLSGTVISETVNMSSRLESLTKQYHTAMLVSKSTIDRMKDPDSLDLRYLGIVQVAGVNEVEALYEVLDCMSDEVREKRSANNRGLKEAIRLFSLGRRSEAIDALQKIADSGKGDYVTDLYLKYISEMSDDDKANVFRFVRK